MMTKEKLTAVFKAAGLSDAQLKEIHKQFERLQPEGHAEFLRWLGVPEAEALEIRRLAK